MSVMVVDLIRWASGFLMSLELVLGLLLGVALTVVDVARQR